MRESPRSLQAVEGVPLPTGTGEGMAYPRACSVQMGEGGSVQFRVRVLPPSLLDDCAECARRPLHPADL